MNWEKIKSNHFFNQPTEYVYSSTLYDIKEYDKLYENTNDLNHTSWQEFDKKYKTGFQFYNDIRQIDLKRNVVCVWFFKERNDTSGGKDLEIAGKEIKYLPNTFLITKSKDIKILEKKDEYFRRPFLQLDMNENTYDKIIERFK